MLTYSSVCRQICQQVEKFDKELFYSVRIIGIWTFFRQLLKHFLRTQIYSKKIRKWLLLHLGYVTENKFLRFQESQSCVENIQNFSIKNKRSKFEWSYRILLNRISVFSVSIFSERNYYSVWVKAQVELFFNLLTIDGPRQSLRQRPARGNEKLYCM